MCFFQLEIVSYEILVETEACYAQIQRFGVLQLRGQQLGWRF